jgi:hypothetical protein
MDIAEKPFSDDYYVFQKQQTLFFLPHFYVSEGFDMV